MRLEVNKSESSDKKNKKTHIQKRVKVQKGGWKCIAPPAQGMNDEAQLMYENSVRVSYCMSFHAFLLK